MNKKIKILLISCLLFALAKPFFMLFRNSDTFINRIGISIFELNNLYLTTDKYYDINDFKIINLNSGDIVFEKGKFINQISKNNGWCFFEVYYKGELINEVGYDKRNSWNTNDHYFNYSKKNSQPELNLKIESHSIVLDLVFNKKMLKNKEGDIYKIQYYDYFGKLYNEEMI